jgi:monothiol glutaredoxin
MAPRRRASEMLAQATHRRVQQTGIGQAMDIIETIKEQIASNSILLYMKGSPNQPQCGFSARTVQALMACGERFAYVDILANPDIRANLPRYANWPTFPQLWVNGELVGGCDIVTEMYENGELQTLVKEAAAAQSQA